MDRPRRLDTAGAAQCVVMRRKQHGLPNESGDLLTAATVIVFSAYLPSTPQPRPSTAYTNSSFNAMHESRRLQATDLHGLGRLAVGAVIRVLALAARLHHRLPKHLQGSRLQLRTTGFKTF